MVLNVTARERGDYNPSVYNEKHMEGIKGDATDCVISVGEKEVISRWGDCGEISLVGLKSGFTHMCDLFEALTVTSHYF